MMIDLTASRRALAFIVDHRNSVLAGSALYGFVFAFQSYFTALAGARVEGAAPTALVLGIVAFFVFVPAMTAWGRAALGKPVQGLLGLKVGPEEGRMAWTLFLVLVLMLAVLPVVGLVASAPIIGATVIAASEAGLTDETVEGVSALGLLGPGGWAIVYLVSALSLIFSFWFFIRLAMAYPATLDAGAVRVMKAWPLSGKGRSIGMFTTVLAAILPGVFLLAVFNYGVQLTLGAYPAVAQSASGEAGGLTVPALAFIGASFVYGVGKAALIGAPACAAMCVLYQDLRERPATANF